jgi:hypothetical protein
MYDNEQNTATAKVTSSGAKCKDGMMDTINNNSVLSRLGAVFPLRDRGEDDGDIVLCLRGNQKSGEGWGGGRMACQMGV